MLVEAAGETISNSQIMARAWQTTVEEGSLRVHIGALRKALGDGRGGNRFIANNPGRGYAFVAPVRRETARNRRRRRQPAEGTACRRHSSALSAATRRSAIGGTAGRRRLLTIVGAGGIGKTTVAIAVAEPSPRHIRTASGLSRCIAAGS